MKNVMNFLLLSLIVGAITFGCNPDDCPEPESEFETKDFNATFHTDLFSLAEDSINCGPPRNFLNVQIGSGSETTVGNFEVRMSFCVDVTTFEYAEALGVLTATNGDELYLDASGQVVPTTKEGYDLEFKDPFTIIGGTGKFAGATGNGMTESYVNMTTNRTDHIWKGTLLLKK